MTVVSPSRPRRATELLLIILALAIGIAANVLAGIGMETPITNDYWIQAGVMTVLAFAFHVVLRVKARYADPYILPIVLTLNGLGIAMIHRLDLAKDPQTHFASSQLVWTTLAMVIAMGILWFLNDHRRLRNWTYLFLVASGVMLVLPLIPGLGMEINGARIWVNLGIGQFQPGEIAKITLAIFFAGYLSANRDLILLAGKKIGPMAFPRVRDLAPLVVAWLISMGVLIFQRDLGSAVLFFGLFLAMIYLATSRLSWIILGLLAVAIGGTFAVSTFDHVQARINGWLNAFDPEVINAQGGSHQVVQGLFGLASGGLLGTGLGGGRPDLVYAANSDMIIASFGEEVGFVGLAAIILLFVLLITRFIRAALGARDSFGKLLAAGLAVSIGIQCFVVMGGVLRVIPLTGLTTPFMAAGGTSILANWIIVALVLMVSHAARRPIIVGPMVNASGDGSGTGDRAHAEGATPSTPQPVSTQPSSTPPATAGGGHQ
ncbi:FtsW/RodA/SpoVE family cell cycle protein [Auritidibacter ignavus]|uniref:FtsW/RodA/SpoVE family cell cycle protein n=1 Tax=Auritidibacter ignavus TaxID=678932 RepID=UPI000F041182|nr:FtsW/RodA/SpoVE family cell cycle protein [Auritidibacter ignavus]NIH72678.1 cell division protein FtsW (lipid II flippase) [Auritidibacter ignavus]RMX22305.1 FtsW/RodA/SpoVE family cell cycle protein [Auritidibacter ignavus]WGH83381.1 FtsW/RodA/SpoVE family cell cycle protein [Auritidibacter ignavus]